MTGGSRRDTAVRLFVTCWLVYSVHLATNMVRESYLALAIGDHLSFRVDEYAGMHDDIFEHPGHGWHIASAPGASMLGAVPYAIARPAIDAIVRRVNGRRAATADGPPPAYETPIAADRRLYEEAWRRGYDVKFGLASAVMQSLGMAVVCAIGVVLLYLLLDGWVGRRAALWLALLYGFGTPAFYRAAFLNHNMLMAMVGLFGFALLRKGDTEAVPWGGMPERRRFLLAGLCGGLAVLLDYSGALLLAGLWMLGVSRLGLRRARSRSSLSLHVRYALGAVGPLLLLWFYQWRSFGHPFAPPQRWMPGVPYADLGYRGFTWPSAELARLLALDFRYGLFVACPLFLLALAAPIANRRLPRPLPRRDLVACAAFSVAFLLFFSCVQYTRWQFNTGIRYLAPAFPFLFLLAAVTLLRMPRIAAWTVGALSVAFAWMQAMSRDVSGGKVSLSDPDIGRGVLDPVLTVLREGPRLPALTTLSRMDAYGALSAGVVRPWHLLLALAIAVVVVWKWPPRRAERPG